MRTSRQSSSIHQIVSLEEQWHARCPKDIAASGESKGCVAAFPRRSLDMSGCIACNIHVAASRSLAGYFAMDTWDAMNCWLEVPPRTTILRATDAAKLLKLF